MPEPGTADPAPTGAASGETGPHRDQERHPSGGEPADARPGWQPDPTGHFEFRWWDGAAWTNRVAGEGVDEPGSRFASLPP
ncbi:MAG: DUF2510 domain-containing protein, partial [Actinomycetota bacterium]